MCALTCWVLPCMPAVVGPGQVGVRVVCRGVGVVHMQGPAWGCQAGHRHALCSVEVPLPHPDGGPIRAVLVIPVVGTAHSLTVLSLFAQGHIWQCRRTIEVPDVLDRPPGEDQQLAAKVPAVEVLQDIACSLRGCAVHHHSGLPSNMQGNVLQCALLGHMLRNPSSACMSSGPESASARRVQPGWPAWLRPP